MKKGDISKGFILVGFLSRKNYKKILKNTFAFSPFFHILGTASSKSIFFMFNLT